MVDQWDAHGKNTPSRYCSRGTYSYEVYGNTFIYNTVKRAMNLRGGKGVIYDNDWTISNFTGTPNATIFLQDYRSNDATCTNAEGYPCIDQINNLYIWNNTLNTNALVNGTDIEVSTTGYNPTHIQSGRDYFPNAPGGGYEPYTYQHLLIPGESRGITYLGVIEK